jgi:ABC-type nitrate/sulfonate/bicarbonate transport system permease component
VFGGLAILMVLVTLVDTFIRWVQRRVLVWKPIDL